MTEKMIILLAPIIILYATVLLGGLNWLSPVSIVAHIWQFWMGFSMYYAHDLRMPSNGVYILFSVFIICLIIGATFARLRSEQIRVSIGSSVNYHGNMYTFSIIAFVIQFPILTYYAYKSQSFFSTYLGGDVRSVALGYFDASGDAIYGTSFLRNMLDFLFAGLNIHIIFFGLCVFFTIKRGGFLAFGFALMFFSQLIAFGRVQIYIFALIVFFAGLMLIASKRFKLGVMTTFLIGGFSVIFFLGYGLYAYNKRLGSQGDQSKVIEQYIDYHVMGFSMFGLEYDDPNSVLNRGPGLGIATTNGTQKVVAYFIRRLNPSFIHPAGFLEYNNQQYVEIGFRNGAPVYYNAFYTMLYPLYYDFHIVGIVIGGLLIGYFLHRMYLVYVRTADLRSGVLFLFLFQILLLGLYLPPTDRTSFTTFFIVYYLFALIRSFGPGNAIRAHYHDIMSGQGSAKRFKYL